MANVLADMVLRLGMDSAEIRKGLKTVESELGRFSKSVGGMKRALEGAFAVAGVGAAAAAIGRLVVAGAEAADEVGKMSQRVGVSTEDLSRMGYAAKLSGSSLEGVATGYKKLSKTMADAAGGSKQSAAVFDAIGVSVKDATGNLRPMNDVMLEVADKFAGMEDGAGKAAIAQELFGKSGLDLIPMLNMGSAGLRKMGDEADALGVTVSGQASKSAEAFNDSLERLTTTKDGLARMTAERLTPMLTAFSDELLATAGNSGALAEAADFLATTIRGLVSAGVIVAGVFNVVAKSVGRAAAAITFAIQGEFELAKRAWDAGGDDVSTSIGNTIKRVDGIWADGAAKIEAGAPGTAKKVAAPVVQATGAVKSATAQLKAELAEADRVLAAWSKPKLDEYVPMPNAGWNAITARQPTDGVGFNADSANASGDDVAANYTGITDAAKDAEALKIREDQIAAFAANVEPLLQPAADAANGLFQGILDGSASLTRSVEGLFKGMAQTIIATLVQVGIKRLAMHIAEMALGKKEVAKNAAVAASGAAASQASIPFIGPALAFGAMAAMTAAVMGLSAMFSAEGGFDVPAGSNPVTQLHQREMVLPAEHADTIRELGKGKKGGATPPITIVAWDGKDVRRVLLENPGALADAIQEAERRRLL